MLSILKNYIKSKIIATIIPQPLYKNNIKVNDGSKIANTVVIQLHSKNDIITIGRNSSVRHFCVIRTYSGFLKVGDNTSINPFASIACQGGVTIGNNVRIADHVAIHAAQHVFQDHSVPIHAQGTTGKGILIEDDVWIGAGAIILDGVTIGRGSVVGAGAVVTKSCQPGSVIGGVPARLLKMRGGFE